MTTHSFNYIRKLFHILGIILAILYFNNWASRETLIIFTGIIFSIFGLWDIFRANHPEWQHYFLRCGKMLIDEKDTHGLNGSTLYALGCLVTLLCFNRIAAIIGISILALADPMAAWVGTHIRSPHLRPHVSVAGTLACGITAALITLMWSNIGIACLIAIVAMITEAFSGRKWDNAALPIATAAAFEISNRLF